MHNRSERAAGKSDLGELVNSAVWIGADSLAVLYATGGHSCPNVAHKTVRLSDTFHADIDQLSRVRFPGSPFAAS